MASGFGRGALLASVAIVCVADAGPAWAQSKNFEVPAQAAASGISELGRQADIQIVAARRFTQSKKTNAVRGVMTVDRALDVLLDGTGLVARRTGTQTFTIVPPVSDAPKAQPLAGSSVQAVQEARAPAYDEIIVTAQKKEERITDVPIAMSAFSAEALDDYKIEGGSELLRAVPNVSFSKTNFSMYNFSIRGIGTKAISASSDPAVAVSFNNTPLARNRLFEAEFFDVKRIEVLRGPQGTLYGRNATAGVVNMISNLPEEEFGGELKGEVGSFETRRLSGFINIPLAETLAVRAAGAMTKRDGFDYNSFTKKRVNGRDLWSTRITAEWQPTDNFSANFVWQHFEEDDDRSRTGKQLCTRDPGPSSIGGIPIENEDLRGRLSQGCLPGSIYSDEAYGTPNGRSLAYMVAAKSYLYLGLQPGTFNFVSVVKDLDPFGDNLQSKNLREISTSYDPKFRANNDVFQLNFMAQTDSGLQFHSQTAYSTDDYFSTQDYNRSISNPAFNDSLAPLSDALGSFFNVLIDTSLYPGMSPGGVVCDDQIGCSDRLMSVDLSTSKNRQWYQEFRVQSDFDGVFNFNLGVNYLDFKTEDKYYVFNNVFGLLSKYLYGTNAITNPPALFGPTALKSCPIGYELTECVGYESNSIENLEDYGHNYFLSKNRVRTKSYAIFSEAYTDLDEDLKLTVGLRYTRDKKVSSQIPSQLLLGGGSETPDLVRGGSTGGRVNYGYPALPDIKQRWGALTGRVVLDWKPQLSFTDDSLFYLSYSRGYKGGGTNPPRVDLNPAVVQYLPLAEEFNPEYVNAFEVGSKNMLLGGALKLNATAFLYDYKDYQISQIIDRISFNENFGAISYGLELEAVWKPSAALRFDANLGLLKTRIKKGNESIDVMDRTAGNSDWVVLRPWLQAPSNCIAPRVFVEKILNYNRDNVDILALSALCAGSTRFGNFNPNFPGQQPYNTRYGFTWDPLAPYNPATVGLDMAGNGSGAPNGGRGFAKPLVGKELPNSPRMTLNVGGAV